MDLLSVQGSAAAGSAERFCRPAAASSRCQATMEINSRQGDLADQASGNNEVHIQLKLKQTDAKILQAIEEALYRMEKGTYGDLPRLRRADRAGPAERHPLDARLHHLQGKAELVKATETARAPAEFYRDKLAHAAAPRRRRAARRALRLQQHLPVRHRPRRHARSAGCATPSPTWAARSTSVPEPDDRRAGKGAEAQASVIADGPRCGAGVRRQVAAARRRAAQRAPPQHAAASSSARRSSTSASSTRRSPAAPTSSAAAPTAPAPAAACWRRGGSSDQLMKSSIAHCRLHAARCHVDQL